VLFKLSIAFAGIALELGLGKEELHVPSRDRDYCAPQGYTRSRLLRVVSQELKVSQSSSTLSNESQAAVRLCGHIRAGQARCEHEHEGRVLRMVPQRL
jgi:hypothetical protein